MASSASPAYQRWSPATRAMVDAEWAKGFSFAGFEDARLFTAVEVDPSEGQYAFRLYEGRAGMAVGPYARFRSTAEAAGRKALCPIGRERFESRVAEALNERAAVEAPREGEAR